MNILIVEDEPRLAEALAHILQENDYHAEIVDNGNDGLTYALSDLYDLVLLDIMLPGKDGLEIVRTMRRQGNATPVLMLTARTETSDKVKGLDAGADDYMTKPFEAPELLARLRALTRRRGDVLIDEVTFADVKLDLSTHDLSCHDAVVHLSGKEFEVMSILMTSSARVVSKQDLLSRVWADSEASENSVEAYVSFLRKKLAHIGSKVQITTLRMLGYRLEVLAD